MIDSYGMSESGQLQLCFSTGPMSWGGVEERTLPPLDDGETRWIAAVEDLNGDGSFDLVIEDSVPTGNGFTAMRRLEIWVSGATGAFVYDSTLLEVETVAYVSLSVLRGPVVNGHLTLIVSHRLGTYKPFTPRTWLARLESTSAPTVTELPQDFGLFRFLGSELSQGGPGVLIGFRITDAASERGDYTMVSPLEPSVVSILLQDVEIGLGLGDWDGDGDRDAVLAEINRFRVTENVGTPSAPVFAQQARSPVGLVSDVAIVGGADGAPFDLAVVGKADDQGQGGMLAIVRETPREWFTVLGSTPLPDHANRVASLGVGAGGELVMAVVYKEKQADRLRVLSYVPGEGFDIVQDTELPGLTGDLSSGDLDGDGRLDLVATMAKAQSANLAYVLWGAAGGALSDPVGVDGLGSRESRFAALRDMNGDGRADMVIGSGRGARVRVWTVGTDRTITPIGSATVPGLGMDVMTVGDFDADGVPDVAFTIGARLFLTLGIGDGSLSPPVFTDLGEGILSIESAGLHPFAGDQILAAFEDGMIRVLNGAGQPLEDRVYVPSVKADVFLAADIDRDGAVDMVFADAQAIAVLHGLVPGCPADLVEPFGVLDPLDVTAFLNAFGSLDPAADFAEPSGVWNFFDVSAFLGAYNAGCP